jgi:hypothetical protein
VMLHRCLTFLVNARKWRSRVASPASRTSDITATRHHHPHALVCAKTVALFAMFSLLYLMVEMLRSFTQNAI